MSRRAANFTQADVHRVLKAAQMAGPDWDVEIIGTVIRLTRSSPPAIIEAPAQEPKPEAPDTSKWKL